jgi:hypothetical protein
MKDDVTFDVFYAHWNDIVKSNFIQGEKILENRIVRKVGRYLPEPFRPYLRSLLLKKARTLTL